ncbi:hypothetical protein BOW50_02955 [Solemya velum gill symbiont]|uniref:porin n=1 Tax=Solemya velum gill symbiont TaxID=2340 RepID=UPI0009D21F56|nr:porin [Solemya velum gill symbiont]OOZ79897.1 hypothetical protein BOW50_02955 [Solemya velum gill symbiont]
MKKSLLAAMIAAVVAAPAANASVTIYGKIHASIDMIDYSHSRDTIDDIDAWYVVSRASRIGFKGTEDLGNGMSLIWKAETGYDITDGDAWGGGRNAYIGLAGDWGTFLYGNHDTPLKISTGKLDLFGDQLGDYNWSAGPEGALLGPGFHDVRAENAIAYISPNMNGLTFAAAIVPGEGLDYDVYGGGPDYTGPHTQNGLADSYSVAAMYSNNGLHLSAGYENLMAGTYYDTLFSKISPSLSSLELILREHDDDMQVWRVGAGYTMNAFTVNFVYENQQFDDVGIWRRNYSVINPRSEYEADAWQVSAAYDFGNNRIKLAYGENDADVVTESGPISGKSQHWTLGLDHKLSKRTMAYAQYAHAESDADYEADGRDYSMDEETSGFSIGLVHSF